ncbi:MAG: hydrogenase maturation nickel metallochaperone HypA [Acidobacteria bacterium]|nr:hydrogenase maturation nickel metallochaperone HypA [Acidobacteriota bacterium]
MHESSVVGALVREVNELVERRVTPPARIHLRTTTAFPAETVRLMFAMHASGTPIENVPLDIEVEPLRRTCECGCESIIHKHDLHGHLFFCPACHQPAHIGEAHRLECREIEVSVSEPRPLGSRS